MQATLHQAAQGTFDHLSNALRTLSLAANSQSTPCSADDLTYLRRLVFDSSEVKSIGRLEDGHLQCATLTGALSRPVPVSAPDYTDDFGIRWYIDSPLSISGRDGALILATERTSIILDQRRFTELMHGVYKSTLLFVGQKDDQILFASETSGPFTADRLGTLIREPTDMVRAGDWFLAKECDPMSVLCPVYAISAPVLLDGERPLLVIITLFGAIGSGLIFVAVDARGRQLKVRLRKAIRRDELKVHYQPQVNFVEGTVIGCEALLRWNDHGVPQSPQVAVEAAEANGFIGELTRLVVRHVIDELGEILHQRDGFRVSINFSATDLSRETFLDELHAQLGAAGIAPRQVTIELTEHTAGDNTALTRTLTRARAAGHKVAIDDFGIGYSNLGYLRDHPVDYLKIDKSFTEMIGTGSVRSIIVTQIIDLAKVLGLDVIVEGLETEEQIAYVVRHGAQCGQGWVFADAMPAQGLADWLATSDWGRGVAVERTAALDLSHAG